MFTRQAALPVFTIAEADPRDPLAALREQEQRREDYNRAQDYIVNYTMAGQGLFPPNPALDAMPAEEVYDRLAAQARFHDENEDRSASMPDEMIKDMQDEIKGILSGLFGGAPGANVRFFHVDENGDLIEG